MLKPSYPGNNRGFALIELGAVILIIGLLAIGFSNWQEGARRDATARRTAEGITLIQEALYSYRLNPVHGYTWPTVITALDSYLPNFSGGGRNGVGQPYSLDPPPPPVSPTDGIVISTLVRVGVPVPGHEAAPEAVLARGGTKDMQGNPGYGRSRYRQPGRSGRDAGGCRADGCRGGQRPEPDNGQPDDQRKRKAGGRGDSKRTHHPVPEPASVVEMRFQPAGSGRVRSPELRGRNSAAHADDHASAASASASAASASAASASASASADLYQADHFPERSLELRHHDHSRGRQLLRAWLYLGREVASWRKASTKTSRLRITGRGDPNPSG